MYLAFRYHIKRVSGSPPAQTHGGRARRRRLRPVLSDADAAFHMWLQLQPVPAYVLHGRYAVQLPGQVPVVKPDEMGAALAQVRHVLPERRADRDFAGAHHAGQPLPGHRGDLQPLLVLKRGGMPRMPELRGALPQNRAKCPKPHRVSR